MVVTQGRASVRTIGLTGLIEVQKTGCKGFGYTLYPKGYKLQGRRAGHPPAPGWLSHTQRAHPPRRAAPRGPTPGGARPPPTAQRLWLAWLLQKPWTAPGDKKR